MHRAKHQMARERRAGFSCCEPPKEQCVQLPSLPSLGESELQLGQGVWAKGVAQGVTLGAQPDLALSATKPMWQGWLQDWEERQKLEFKLHEKHTKDLVDATRELVVELKSELLDKLGQLGDSRSSGMRPPRESDLRETVVSQEVLVEEDAGEEGEEDLDSGMSPAALLLQMQQQGHGSQQQILNSQKAVPIPKMNEAMSLAAGMNKKAQGMVAASVAPSPSKHSSERPDKRHWTQKYLASVVDHPYFNYACGLLIIGYSVCVGVIADVEMRRAVSGDPSPSWPYAVDLFFTVAFLVEAFMHLGAEGASFFCSPDWKWNIFDLTVAIVGLMDVIDAFQDMNLGFMRIVRTAVKILRVVRIFSIFTELRVMIASIVVCLPSLTWAFTLLVSVIYIFSVILMQGASSYIKEHRHKLHPELEEALSADFGDISRTIYSLVQAVSGGRSWGEYAEPFVVISPWYGLVFTMFVIFVIFGVLNILTGVFVEGTASLAAVDKELGIQEEMSRHEAVMSQIRSLFQELDVDESGTLSYAELTRNLQDERVKAYFAMLQMDVSEAQGLFQLLDRDESGEVSIEEFIMTCMRLKGNARSIDLATMLFESKRLHSVIKHYMRHVDRTTNEISDKLSLLQRCYENGLFPPSPISPPAKVGSQRSTMSRVASKKSSTGGN